MRLKIGSSNLQFGAWASVRCSLLLGHSCTWTYLEVDLQLLLCLQQLNRATIKAVVFAFSSELVYKRINKKKGHAHLLLAFKKPRACFKKEKDGQKQVQQEPFKMTAAPFLFSSWSGTVFVVLLCGDSLPPLGQLGPSAQRCHQMEVHSPSLRLL